MKLSSFVLLSVMTFAPLAHAQNPCEAETKTICSASNESAIACLAKNQAKLSSACADFVRMMSSKRVDPCAQDADRVCANVRDKKKKLSRCMKENLNQLSPACKAAGAVSIKDGSHSVGFLSDDPCAQDMSTHCQGMKGDEGWKCLETKTASLSKACADAVKGINELKRLQKK